MWGKAAALAVLAATALVVPASASAGDVVRTEYGPVRGVDGTWQGIPYAAPPVGELRWRAPQPPVPWQQVRDANTPGSPCPQDADPVVGTPASMDEDCLHLDVVTPHARANRPRPVMVWVHGGGFRTGSGSSTQVDRLARSGDVVVVKVDYRLGVFGFLGYPGLDGSGTFGLQDQQAALRWVRHNIAGFGGDPRNVTVFGESGGGDSMCALLASPTAAGLFDKIIVQSSACGHVNAVDALIPGVGAGGDTWKPLAVEQDLGTAAAHQLGCADLACLRGKPTAELLHATVPPVNLAPYWSPAIGTPVLPLHPADALASGRFHHVPTVLGTTRDEATLLTAALDQPGTPFSAQDLSAYATRAFGDRAQQVLDRYPVGDQAPSRVWASIVTDRVYACPALDADRVLARQVPVHAYEMVDRTAPAIFHVNSLYPLGAYHGSDAAYLFDHSTVRYTPAQARLSAQMIGYWTRFAAIGDPNTPGVAHWARFGGDARVQGLAPDAVGPVDLGVEHQCDLWSSGTVGS